MSTDVIFYTQIVSFVAFVGTLFGLYRVMVSQKDSTIELLREQNRYLARQLEDLKSQSPDVLAGNLAKRIGLLADEIARLNEDQTQNQGVVKQKEEELQSLILQRDSLALESGSLKRERERLEEGLGQLRAERDHLTVQRAALIREQQTLQLIARGLRLAIDKVEAGGGKFFSIHNTGDPINKLSDPYGWKVWSDNWWGSLGYYLVLEHQNVLDGKRIVVTREFEIDALKKKLGKKWVEEVARATEHFPILALDYSYLGLLADEGASAGGTLYRAGHDPVNFHAPLGGWAKELAAVFEHE